MCGRALAVACALALCACAAPAGRRNPRWDGDPSDVPGPSDPAAPWLELESPSDGLQVTSPIALAEVRGRAGAGPHGPQDLVFTIDTSGSVFGPSGIDVDGDGIVGDWAPQMGIELRAPLTVKKWTTDFDDVVLKLEISAAKQLARLLDPESTRVGMVKFGDRPFVEQPVGSTAEFTTHLEEFRYVMRGGTDIVAGLHQSIDLLEDAPPVAGVQPSRAILLLTDGEMVVDEADEAALQEYVARCLSRARRADVRIFTFGVGTTAASHDVFLHSIAHATGGRHTPVPASRDIAVELPIVSLTGLSDVELRNETNGATGRAVRVFPNGSFDGYVPLREGENSLVITATLDDGRATEARARVTFTRPKSPTHEQLAAAQSLAEKLRARTIETDLARRAQAEHKRRRLKELELEPEPQELPP